MKKIILVAFAMIGMTIASCGNGKSDEAVENDSTAGDTVLVGSTVGDTLAVDTIVAE